MVEFLKTLPYAFAAMRYLEAGWSPLPLYPSVNSRKGVPPKGYTGAGKMASREEVEDWVRHKPGQAIAIRMPPDAAGIDVDAYKEAGLKLYRDLTRELGALPATWISTARDDGVSGIRCFRVPHGARFASRLGEGIEIISHGYRFARCWPSSHPDLAIGTYQWITPGGRISDDEVPRVSELPSLPEAWLGRCQSGTSAYDDSGNGFLASPAFLHPDILKLQDEGIPDGAGHDDMLSQMVFIMARDGFADDDIARAWISTVNNTPMKRPDWPYTSQDFYRHLDGAKRKLGQGGQLTSGQQSWLETRAPADPGTPFSQPDLHPVEPAGSGRQETAGGLMKLPEMWLREPLPGEIASQGGSRAGYPDDSNGNGSLPPPPPPAASWDDIVPDGYQIPPDYDMSDQGVYFIHRPARGESWAELISHRPVIITKLASTADGDEAWYELTWLDSETQVRSVVAPVGEIADSRKLPPLFGDLVVTSHTSGKLAKFFGELATLNTAWLQRRRERVAIQLGWQGEGSADFAFGDGRPSRVRDMKGTGPWLEGHAVAGSLAAWKEAITACKPMVIPLVALAASFSAPLLRILGIPSFAFDISAETTTGKTTVLRLAASVWGDPDRIVRSWFDTLVANEHYLSCLRGVPLFLNESQLARPESVSGLVYSLSEGHSKSRSRQDGTGLTGNSSYESVLISCGETSLASFVRKGGIVPRIVTAEGNPLSSAEMARAVDEVTGHNYGYAAEVLISQVSSYPVSGLRNRYAELSQGLRSPGLSSAAGRRADNVAVMQLAAEIAEAASLMEVIAPEVWHHLARGGGALEDDADDMATRAMELIAAEVAGNPRAFWVHGQGGGWFDDMSSPGGGWAGRYQAGQYVAVRPAWLRQFLNREGYDDDRIIKTWRKRGWLEFQHGKTTTVVSINGKSCRCVRITCSELLGLIGSPADTGSDLAI